MCDPAPSHAEGQALRRDCDTRRTIAIKRGEFGASRPGPRAGAYSRSDLVFAPLNMPGQLPFAPAATVAKNAMRQNDCDGFREGFTRRRKLL